MQLRTGQVNVDQHRVGQVGSGQVYLTQFHTMQPYPTHLGPGQRDE